MATRPADESSVDPPADEPFDLPLQPPIEPMLAKLARSIPDGDGWLYEPKWDGFRCIVFREGDRLELFSRKLRPLTRYFPELLDPLRAGPPGTLHHRRRDRRGRHRWDGLDFDALLQRIHPAKSRIDRLAAETPAAFVAFDVLADGDRAVLDLPMADRRALLESLVGAERDRAPHACEHVARRRRRMVRSLRRCGARRRDRQAARRAPTSRASAR